MLVDIKTIYEKISKLEEEAMEQVFSTPENSISHTKAAIQAKERRNLKRMLFELTPVDPNSLVKRGRWVRYTHSKLFSCTCSNCNADAKERTPYCPWCGAKMDLKGE